MANGGTTIHYNSNNNGTWWLFFQDQRILSRTAGGENNITRLSGSYTGSYPTNLWIADTLNGVVVATNGKDAPQAQYDASDISPTTKFADIAAWTTKSANATCKFIVAFKNFLVALNITDTIEYPNMIWWSNEADPGTLPADWDYESDTSKSGRHTLGSDTGAIIGAKRLRDDLLIYCETGVYRMSWTGGRFVFRFTEVFKQTGLFGPRSVVEFEGKHMLVTKDDIIIHDGHQQQTIGDSKVNNEVFGILNANEVNFTYLVSYPTLKEVWLAVSEDADVDYPTVIFAYQWQDNAWSKRAIPKARHMQFIPSIDAASDSSNEYEWDTAPDIAWDEADETWDSSSLVVGDFRMFGLGGDNGNTIYEMDFGYDYTDSGYDYTDTITEIEDINVTGDESVQIMHSIYPRISGTQPIWIDIGGTVAASGVYKWKENFSFDPLTDYKIPARIKGRRFAVRFRPQGPYPYRIEGFDILYEQGGRR